MGITVGERATALELVQDIAYTYNEDDYLRKYSALCEAVPVIVKTYYDRNWHNIRCEWVTGLKKSINFCTRTNNRIESFFSKLKSFVSRRGNLKELISGLMSVITILRNERSHRLMKFLTRLPTAPVPNGMAPFQKFVTPFAFQHIQSQMMYSEKVNVLSPNEVQTSSGVKQVTVSSCECDFFKSMVLPCRHIFAIRRYTGEDMFCADLINARWTIDFYKSQRYVSEIRPRLSIGVQPVHKTRVLSENQKYKETSPLLEDIQRCLVSCGTSIFQDRMDTLKQILGFWAQNKEVFVGEHVVMQGDESGFPSMNESEDQPVEQPVGNIGSVPK